MIWNCPSSYHNIVTAVLDGLRTELAHIQDSWRQIMVELLYRKIWSKPGSDRWKPVMKFYLFRSEMFVQWSDQNTNSEQNTLCWLTIYYKKTSPISFSLEEINCWNQFCELLSRVTLNVDNPTRKANYSHKLFRLHWRCLAKTHYI